MTKYIDNFIDIHMDFSENLWDQFEAESSFKQDILHIAEYIISSELELGLPLLPDIPRQNGYEINILFSNDAQIQELNHSWRKKDRPTNVLSFPSLSMDEMNIFPPDAPVFLGDIILSFETIAMEAKENYISKRDHILRLIIHSCFHLLGYSHEDDEDFQQMFLREKSVLQHMNITNYIDQQKDII